MAQFQAGGNSFWRFDQRTIFTPSSLVVFAPAG
jgi:hypothetical protein